MVGRVFLGLALLLCQAAAVALPDLGGLITRLRQHVHGCGSLLSTRERLVAATGRPLDPASFQRQLRARYLPD